MRIKTTSSDQTYLVGKALGQELGRMKDADPLVVALSGDLGAGKTTFVKGLAEGLGVKDNVVSPTFILIGTYKGKRKTLYHVDPYRLDDAKSLASDIKELSSQEHAVIALEWAERLKPLIPDSAIWISFHHGNADEREIVIS